MLEINENLLVCLLKEEIENATVQSYLLRKV